MICTAFCRLRMVCQKGSVHVWICISMAKWPINYSFWEQKCANKWAFWQRHAYPNIWPIQGYPFHCYYGEPPVPYGWYVSKLWTYRGVKHIGHFACKRILSASRFHTYTRGLPKCPKMAVTEICHVIEHFHRCQNVPFIFSLSNWDILASATSSWPNRCRNAKISHKGKI